MLNAANEVAVEAFLQGRIRFIDIARMIESVLNAQPVQAVEALDVVFEADAQARALAGEWLAGH